MTKKKDFPFELLKESLRSRENVDIWVLGEVFKHLRDLLKSGQIKDCEHLKVKKGAYNAFYPECKLKWANRISAENAATIATPYYWPECLEDCPKYSKSKDFIVSLTGEERKTKEAMNQGKIPTPIIGVVGDVLGNHYYSHNRLNALFWESGAPGDPPEGNCVLKCQRWLKRCNSDPKVDAFVVLGKVLEDFMEMEDADNHDEIRVKKRERVEEILAKHGLSYHQGGQIIGAGTGLPSRSLKEILASRDLSAIEVEFKRAIDNVETDPAAGITAACSMIESLCKVYIEDEGLQMPSKQIIKNLWKVVRENIGLDPRLLEDQDISRVLSGFTSVVDGIGAFRTHTGSAHGRGRKSYRLEARHARLAIHAAHTIVAFVIETWETKKNI